jgi:hypothetical protein
VTRVHAAKPVTWWMVHEAFYLDIRPLLSAKSVG